MVRAVGRRHRNLRQDTERLSHMARDGFLSFLCLLFLGEQPTKKCLSVHKCPLLRPEQCTAPCSPIIMSAVLRRRVACFTPIAFGISFLWLFMSLMQMRCFVKWRFLCPSIIASRINDFKLLEDFFFMIPNLSLAVMKHSKRCSTLMEWLHFRNFWKGYSTKSYTRKSRPDQTLTWCLILIGRRMVKNIIADKQSEWFNLAKKN